MEDELKDVIRANNYIAIHQMLKDRKLNFRSDIRGEGQVTPLIFAAIWGSLDCLKVILKKAPRAKINDVASNKKTALMYAAENGYVDCVKLLIESGADLSAKDQDDRTAYEIVKARKCFSEQYKFMPVFAPVVENMKSFLEALNLDNPQPQQQIDGQTVDQQIVDVVGDFTCDDAS